MAFCVFMGATRTQHLVMHGPRPPRRPRLLKRRTPTQHPVRRPRCSSAERRPSTRKRRSSAGVAGQTLLPCTRQPLSPPPPKQCKPARVLVSTAGLRRLCKRDLDARSVTTSFPVHTNWSRSPSANSPAPSKEKTPHFGARRPLPRGPCSHLSIGQLALPVPRPSSSAP